ncbi:MAG: HNH endonuclease [Firmicutes bacterium]|nr:HNH endonuclease [Bacillota bacterium]
MTREDPGGRGGADQGARGGRRRRGPWGRGNTPAKRQLLAALLTQQAGRCAWCRRPLWPQPPRWLDAATWYWQHAPTVDHVTPRSQGGTDAPANLVAACARCNRERGATGAFPRIPPWGPWEETLALLTHYPVDRPIACTCGQVFDDAHGYHRHRRRAGCRPALPPIH